MIQRLVLWNVARGEREGTEHDKLLYHYSRDPAHRLERYPGLKQASLGEGVLGFVNLFTSDDDGMY